MKNSPNVFEQLLDSAEKDNYEFKTYSGRIKDEDLRISNEGPNYILLTYPDSPIKPERREVFLFERYVENKFVNKVEIPKNILDDIDRKKWGDLEEKILEFLLNNNKSAAVELDEKNCWYIN